MNPVRTRTITGVLLGIMLLPGVVGLIGCGSGPGPSSGSFERGEAEYDKGNWFDAVENLRLFIRRAPTDARAARAQYLIGMARYEEEDYPVAAVEFEILRKDYPTSDLAEESSYMQGMCYVEQVPRIDLDQSVTQQAVQHFTAYLKEYPGGKRRTDVEEQLRELYRHLDVKELKAAQLYMKLGQERAAAVTAQALLDERPGSELRPQVLLLAGRAWDATDDPEKARTALEELVQKYPDSGEASEAGKLLDEVGAETPDGDTP